MERLKAMALPDDFSVLRVAKSSLEVLRFEGEVETRAAVHALASRIDGKNIKLSGFTETLKVRASAARDDFPTRPDWESFFRGASDMDERVAGERPDTLHLQGLPCRWFAEPGAADPDRPSEAVLRRALSVFGAVRAADVPCLDPHREEVERRLSGKEFHSFGYGGRLHFQAYVQYEQYCDFERAMGALRGVKLMHTAGGKALACNIKVTFDTTKHLSDASVRRRESERQKIREAERQRQAERQRLLQQEQESAQQESLRRVAEERLRRERREQRERDRRQRQLLRTQRRGLRRERRRQQQQQRGLLLRVKREERQLLLAQRRLHAVRLLRHLLGRTQVELQRRDEEQRQREAHERRLLALAEERRCQGDELRRRERRLRRRLLRALERRRLLDDERRCRDDERRREEKRRGLVATRLRSAVVPRGGGGGGA
ncbi:A-kinase anchor protein 17A, partial [Lethenteron reissneri]|uniref:A-kinase anchor protein 17A n=1 Tax=Lethenteron reissneri TaxID=7753 RepID=UPI002AB67530